MEKQVDHKAINRLLADCIKGQRKAQRQLYDLLFEGMLYTVSKFRLREAEAEDILQEAFIKIFNSLGSYDSSKATIQTWANLIAKRQSINYCKSKYRQNLPLAIDELSVEQTGQILQNEGYDYKDIFQSIERMPETYRTVIKRYIIEGMRHAAIAKELNITESSSRVYLVRAIKFLQQDLKNIDYER